jgi:hypothetical protein
MQEPQFSAGIGELKNMVSERPLERGTHASEQTAIRWTPALAIACLPGALLFAWVFIHMILVLVFPRTVALH